MSVDRPIAVMPATAPGAVIAPTDAGFPRAVGDSRIIVAKELTQTANRTRFHLEKAAFAAGLSALFVYTVYGLGGARAMDVELIATLGRKTFMTASAASCAILSLASLGAASGIVLSEMTGKRLDVLRITSLSLEGILLGKGLAVMLRSLLMLVLFLPVMAAIQLIGGVSQSDILMVLTITSANIFAFTMVGLLVSAGARTPTERIMRAFIHTGRILLITTGLSMMLTPLNTTGWGAALGAVSPIAVWSMAAKSGLAWEGAVVNAASCLVIGFLSLVASGAALAGSIRTYESRVSEAKIKSVSRSGIRDDLKKLRTSRFAGALYGFWSRLTGGLVGGQILRMNFLSVAGPNILIAAVFVAWLIVVVGFGHSISSTNDMLTFFIEAVLLPVAAIVTVDSCGIIAREKAAHTAEILATTPAGGVSMVLWKGAAIFLCQSPAILICFAAAALTVTARGWDVTLAWILGYASCVLLLCALGVSLSLSMKTPAAAVGLALVTVFALVPLARYAVSNPLWVVFAKGSDHSESGLAVTGLLALCAIGMLARNIFPSASAGIVALATGIALSAWPLFFSGGHWRHCHWYVPGLGLVLPMSNSQDAVRIGLTSAAINTLTAIILAAGAWVRFDTILLSGKGRGTR